jgi:hypothetical protein
MGWSLGFDNSWQRDIGYAVPSICDHPKCNKKIDRGLAYVCGGYPYGGEKGCGLYFCYDHLIIGRTDEAPQLCPKCFRYEKTTYKPKPDLKEWTDRKAEII